MYVNGHREIFCFIFLVVLYSDTKEQYNVIFKIQFFNIIILFHLFLIIILKFHDSFNDFLSFVLRLPRLNSCLAPEQHLGLITWVCQVYMVVYECAGCLQVSLWELSPDNSPNRRNSKNKKCK